MDGNTLTFWAILIIAAAIVLAKAIDTFGDVRKARHLSRSDKLTMDRQMPDEKGSPEREAMP